MDGANLFYNVSAGLRVYRQEKGCSVRDYLHMVLHCVFRHSFVDTLLGSGLRCGAEEVVTELDRAGTILRVKAGPCGAG